MSDAMEEAQKLHKEGKKVSLLEENTKESTQKKDAPKEVKKDEKKDVKKDEKKQNLSQDKKEVKAEKKVEKTEKKEAKVEKKEEKKPEVAPAPKKEDEVELNDQNVKSTVADSFAQALVNAEDDEHKQNESYAQSGIKIAEGIADKMKDKKDDFVATSTDEFLE